MTTGGGEQSSRDGYGEELM